MNEQAFFESLSDETRRRILVLILKHEELCVCDLFHALEAPQPKVSRHLAVLRDAGVLAQRREGTWVFYRLDPQLPAWAYRTLGLMADGVGNGVPYREDAGRLANAAARQVRCGT
ncbi:MAG: metalloregulator ArsR/SmtB family transcription factor [Sulfuricella sp.]|jgi:ArsR family transcriptional regulator|nr:metalloregulator ArsR/SmtB family transcription factor [Sulfuricella sp.]